MRKSREENVFQSRSLLGNGRCNSGMRMAVQIDPPGRYGVENSAAVLSFKEHAFAAPNQQWRRISAFLRKRVPQMQVRCAHGLLKHLPVEILLKYFDQRCAVDFCEHGNMPDHTHLSVMFYGAPVFDIFLPDQDHTANV